MEAMCTDTPRVGHYLLDSTTQNFPSQMCVTLWLQGSTKSLTHSQAPTFMNSRSRSFACCHLSGNDLQIGSSGRIEIRKSALSYLSYLQIGSSGRIEIRKSTLSYLSYLQIGTSGRIEIRKSTLSYIYEGDLKSFRPSLHETRDKQPLGRYPDRSWCHRHTKSMIQLFFRLSPWLHGHQRQHTGKVKSFRTSLQPM